jgi:uncharacterized repeat protein (TIGR01451 family)
MNGAAGWLVGGPGVWVIGVIYSDGLTRKSLSAVGAALIFMLLAMRHQAAINRWWERLETRLDSGRTRPRSDGLAGRQNHRFRIAIAFLAVPVVFLLGAATGRTLHNDKAALPAQPITSSALGGVDLRLGALNLSDDTSEYSEDVTADVDDVVQVQLTYTNTGTNDASLAVRPSLSEPSAGQQFVRIEVEINGDRDALAIPVGLSVDHASLSLMTGETIARTSDATDSITQKIALPDGAGRFMDVALVPPGESGSVVFFARSQASVVTIDLFAASEIHPEPAAYVNAEPADEVTFEMVVRNAGNVPLRDATVRANLAPGMRQVPGSTEVHRSHGWHSAGDELVDPISPTRGTPAGRLRVGDINVGEKIRVRWKVRLSDESEQVSCVVGVVRAVGMNEYYNTAAVGVPDIPTSCEAI